MASPMKLSDSFDIIKIAVIVAVILGLGTTLFFIIVAKQPYSAIYLVPDSIIHNPDENTLLFSYGVSSSESGKMDYTLQTYANTTLIKTKNFALNQGEILEERDKITLPPDTLYPVKISLKLTMGSRTEEIHFWVNKEN
jgi:hypothetical protein